VIESKLHDFGVFTYRQITDWDNDMAAAFSEKLSFKDHVVRKDWQEQCKVLHREKYGKA
jgi:predicted flap endonuclease-1-like 5' DNA nuclease